MTASLDQIEQEAIQHARQWPIWLAFRARQYEHVVSAAQTNLPEESQTASDAATGGANVGRAQGTDGFFIPLEELGPSKEDTQPGLAIANLLAQTDEDSQNYQGQHAVDLASFDDSGSTIVRGRAMAEAHQRQQEE